MKKQQYRSKEELLLNLKKNEEFQKKMKFTREQFYPALCKASKNVDDTISFLGSINTVMMEIFLGFMKTKRLGELDLIAKLDQKDEKFDDIKSMLLLFEDMSVFDAKSYFEGMKSEISLWCNDEMKTRTLESLPVKWIDEL